MRSIVEGLICRIVEDKLPRNTKDKCLVFNFSLETDYERFHDPSYHNMELVFWRPANYTLVAARKQITAIEHCDIELDNHDCEAWVPDATVREGCAYTEAYSEYSMFSYHDSCWRNDGVGTVVKYLENDDYVGFGMHEYELVDVTPEMEEKFRSLTSGA